MVVTQATAEARTQHIWIVDFETGIGTQLTFEGSPNSLPVWTGDGKAVVFASNRDAGLRRSIYRKPADGSGEAQLLYKADRRLTPTDVLSASILAFSQVRAGDARFDQDIKTLELDGDGSAADFLATPNREGLARFSPDGRWIAYVSDESGQFEVYVRPFPPSAGGQRRVSDAGGFGPIWSPSGEELYFTQRQASGLSLMAVPIRADSGRVYGRPRPLFSPAKAPTDITPDGTQFLFTQVRESDSEGEPLPPPEIIVVQSWFEELKRLVPTD